MQAPRARTSPSQSTSAFPALPFLFQQAERMCRRGPEYSTTPLTIPRLSREGREGRKDGTRERALTPTRLPLRQKTRMGSVKYPVPTELHLRWASSSPAVWLAGMTPRTHTARTHTHQRSPRMPAPGCLTCIFRLSARLVTPPFRAACTNIAPVGGVPGDRGDRAGDQGRGRVRERRGWRLCQKNRHRKRPRTARLADRQNIGLELVPRVCFLPVWPPFCSPGSLWRDTTVFAVSFQTHPLSG